MSRASLRRAWKERRISTLLATGFGIGMIPFAPGTWGSLEGLAVGFVGLAVFAPRLSPSGGMIFSCIVGAAIAAAGVVVSSRTEALADARDPGAIVIDEVAGQILAFAPASFMMAGLASGRTPWWIVFGAPFLLFRLFDIWKPGLIGRLQDLPGGWGIVADDVAAGILAGAITYGIARVW
ncbi:MAG TPA: phosphatidylglycerophosphatase A [Thermoanaerobaculia bacterium]|nr:phosphatidylglycerophosphatase A [Thermoanaerobaculia bacterium]